ncbi:MAG: hypothetical protein FWG91_00650 [Lachnospiraceae bacterium]|nr:hypothetical protein [Lachnospiraceae bacterium]
MKEIMLIAAYADQPNNWIGISELIAYIMIIVDIGIRILLVYVAIMIVKVCRSYLDNSKLKKSSKK